MAKKRETKDLSIRSRLLEAVEFSKSHCSRSVVEGQLRLVRRIHTLHTTTINQPSMCQQHQQRRRRRRSRRSFQGLKIRSLLDAVVGIFFFSCFFSHCATMCVQEQTLPSALSSSSTTRSFSLSKIYKSNHHQAALQRWWMTQSHILFLLPSLLIQSRNEYARRRKRKGKEENLPIERLIQGPLQLHAVTLNSCPHCPLSH